MKKYEAIAVYPENFNEEKNLGIFDSIEEAKEGFRNNNPFTPFCKIQEHVIKAETA